MTRLEQAHLLDKTRWLLEGATSALLHGRPATFARKLSQAQANINAVVEANAKEAK